MTVTDRTAGELAPGGANLGDILERVLDKGLVIAGDIRVNLLDIELLTIKLRLVIASLETAKEVGIDWWVSDPWLSGKQQDLADENRRLRDRIAALEESREDGGARALQPGRGREPESEPGARQDGAGRAEAREATTRRGGRHG